MMYGKIITGGFLRGQRTYIIAGIGILSAIGAYLVGDTDIFDMLQAIFTLGGIYFLRKAGDADKNSKN
ncbi:MAG: hypothetical protein LBJ73_02725 [Rickettsiales bacterium]|nr:hypothetical protein [Rickettsiales bacterium]